MSNFSIEVINDVTNKMVNQLRETEDSFIFQTLRDFIQYKHGYDRGFEDCLAQIANLNLIDHYRENLYEVLELFRKTINKDFDDWKDADDWLFSKLNLTEKDISDIYKGRSIVYVASCRKENK